MTRKNWLRVEVYGTLGVIVLLFLVHPYTRQTVFGPKVAGMPFAYWQDRCRAAALPGKQEPSFIAKLMRLMPPNRRVGAASEAEMLPVFLSLRDDPSEQVRAHVADLLGRYPDSGEARAALLDFLDDPSAIVRAQALRVLAVVQPPDPLALPKLRERLDDGDATCRLWAACAILGREKQPQEKTVAVLGASLKAVDAMRRFQVIGDLCRLGKNNAEMLKVLRQAVADNPGLAFDFANGLQQAGLAAAPLLIELLAARDANARRSAASQLGDLGPRTKDAIPALLALRDDPDASVRYVAGVTLWQIDPQRFAKPAPPPRGAPATR